MANPESSMCFHVHAVETATSVTVSSYPSPDLNCPCWKAGHQRALEKASGLVKRVADAMLAADVKWSEEK